MKKFKYFALFIAAGLFAACSDNLNEGNGDNNDGPKVTEGYVRISINTPTTRGNISRANDDKDGNLDLVDGVENEYAINDGIIAFFKTTKQITQKSDATFVSAYNLTIGDIQDDDSNSQITEKVVTVSQAPVVGDEENLYALVILNKPSVVTVSGTNLEISNEKVTSFADFTKFLEEQQLVDYTTKGFTMCNAPLSNVAGSNTYSSVEAMTLVPVTVYPTENEAESNPAANIYVERVVAKVTLSGFINADKTIQVTSNGSYSGDIVQLDGWTLNVTNKSTSLVRNVSGFTTSGWLQSDKGNISRFVGILPITSSNTYYRIYWAEDKNYNSEISNPASEFNIYVTDNDNNAESNDFIQPDEYTWNKNTYDNKTDEDDHALYCFENTMDYDKQIPANTTSVLLKTTYKTKFGNQNGALAQDFFLCGVNPVKYPKQEDIPSEDGTGTVTDIITHIKNNVTGASIENVAIRDNAPAGKYDSADELNTLLCIKNKNTESDLSPEQKQAIWNAIGIIRYYKEGINYYYSIPIRHFSDSETPWTDGEKYTMKHLGRYGIVRNNWYEINITKISGPGEPGIEEPEEGPNDKPKGYIQAEINVLSWAKRTQDVEL